MKDWNSRTELLIGGPGIEILENSHVLVVGLGGVGAYAAEFLCRSGIGAMTIVDCDTVDLTNINRQLPATRSNIGKRKTEIISDRLLDINPDLKLTVIDKYIIGDYVKELLTSANFDYVVDCIDTLTPKVDLISNTKWLKIPLVSCMGAGGRMDPTKIEVRDLRKSHNCRLARAVRDRLRKIRINGGFKVVFSPEPINEDRVIIEESLNKKSVVGTISYMPPAFGCVVASVVIKNLLAES